MIARPLTIVVALVGMAVPATAQPGGGSDLETLQQAVARNPGQYDLHLRLGIAYLREDRLTDAFIALHKALAVQPRAVEPHFYLGLIYFRRGLLEQEIDAYRQALSRDPDHLPARLNLGHALVAAGALDGAIDAYRSVLERDDDNLVALYNLGIIFAEAGDRKSARTHLERFLALAPPSDPWRTAAEATLQEVVP